MAALSDLERRLVETAMAGETLALRAAAEREPRAGVVRDLLLGQHRPVHARGLRSPATRAGCVAADGQDAGSDSTALPFQVTSNFEILSRVSGTTISTRYGCADSTGHESIQCGAPPSFGT